MNTATRPDEALHASLREFVYFETGLLDERRFDRWYELFDEDGVYWVPVRETAAQTQAERQTHAALALENRMLLKLRIERMRHAQAHSLHPAVRSLHVIQRPEVLDTAVLDTAVLDTAVLNTAMPGTAMPALPPDLHAVACKLIYMERQGERQVTLGGTARYLLRRDMDGSPNNPAPGWRIVEKRVLLLGCDSFLPAIQLFI